MNRKPLFASACIAAAGLVAVIGSIAIAQSSDAPAAEAPPMQLPPGWTQADMQAMVAAGTPGKMHKQLTDGAGTWRGETTMWMHPDAQPMTSQSTSTITPIMDGRYVRIEMTGEMPGMGAYKGLGLYGYDNVSQQFVSTWIDNHSTGMANGVGELSADGKTLTWTFTYNCPITERPHVLREIETFTGPNTRTLEMFGADPKTGEEFKMMRIELTRAP